TLPGKKFHSKRNHISNFEKTYDWSYEEINKENMQECIEMNRKWEAENKMRNPDGMNKEELAIIRAFDNFDELGFKGGLIRANGEVVAYTMGERLNDNTFCTHIEKAFADIRGAYPIINREFAKNTLTEYEFVNREEDMGIEGLRKAKLSYNPVYLVSKYRAVYEG
ncbi:MAG: phosphatidylglycerol lysyltransferase domain-containing protein, partial [Oscillospiraceae bacterium]